VNGTHVLSRRDTALDHWRTKSGPRATSPARTGLSYMRKKTNRNDENREGLLRLSTTNTQTDIQNLVLVKLVSRHNVWARLL